jgi:hypothetical protein
MKDHDRLYFPCEITNEIGLGRGAIQRPQKEGLQIHRNENENPMG